MKDILERTKELQAKGLDYIQIYEVLILELEREQAKRRQTRLSLERTKALVREGEESTNLLYELR